MTPAIGYRGLLFRMPEGDQLRLGGGVKSWGLSSPRTAMGLSRVFIPPGDFGCTGASGSISRL